MLLRVGDEITLVSKGYFYINDKKEIDPERIGAPIYVLITKVGRKYIYGKEIYFELDGSKKYSNFESKYEIDDYYIFKGIRFEFEHMYNTYRKELNEWRKKRDEYERKLHLEASKWVLLELDKWEKENPKPKYDTTLLNKL